MEIPPDVRAILDRYGPAAVIGYAHLVATGAASDKAEWLDQSSSPLGSRRHCALARRLIAADDAKASKVGRRWLVRADAIEAELSRLGARARAHRETNQTSLAQRLGFEEV